MKIRAAHQVRILRQKLIFAVGAAEFWPQPVLRINRAVKPLSRLGGVNELEAAGGAGGRRAQHLPVRRSQVGEGLNAVDAAENIAARDGEATVAERGDGQGR